MKYHLLIVKKSKIKEECKGLNPVLFASSDQLRSQTVSEKISIVEPGRIVLVSAGDGKFRDKGPDFFNYGTEIKERQEWADYNDHDFYHHDLKGAPFDLWEKPFYIQKAFEKFPRVKSFIFVQKISRCTGSMPGTDLNFLQIYLQTFLSVYFCQQICSKNFNFYRIFDDISLKFCRQSGPGGSTSMQ